MISMEVEGQESGRVSSDAALAREGILAAALPTAEHVSLRQPSLAGSGTPQPVNLATSAPARTVNKVNSNTARISNSPYPLGYCRNKNVLVCII